MAVQNYITIQYTEADKGEVINFAYHDFVVSLDGITNYPQYYNFVNFKYILQVFVDDKQIATMKAPPNSPALDNRNALFNVRAIVEDYVKTDQSGFASFNNGILNQSTKEQIGFQTKPHAIHQIDRFARNKSNLVEVYFRVGAEWFEDGVFVKTPIKGLKISSKTNFLPRYYFWNGVLQFSDLQQGHAQSLDYILDGNTKKFLTRKENNIERKVTKTDYETLAFFNGVYKYVNGNNGHQIPLINLASSVYDIYIKAYGSNAFTMIIPNNDSNGGSFNPFFSIQNGVEPPYTSEGLLYVGVGCKNLADNGLTAVGGGAVTEATFDGITHYEVWARNAATNQISEKYTFRLVPEECTYERIRITYLNSLGAWDYFSFTKKSTRTTEITRSNYKANYGYSPLISQPQNVNNNNRWEYGSYEGGTRSYNVNAIETIEANSDWLTDAEAESLKELFVSPVAYIQSSNGNFDPVIVTESDYILQTTANDKLKQYIINIQSGHENRVQRL